MKLFLLVCMCAVAFSACSEKEDGSEAEPQGDFSLLSPTGKLYKEGQTVTVATVDAAGTMRLSFSVRNNTARSLDLTMEQKVLSSDYTKIADHATFCWDSCYPAPLADGFSANDTYAAGKTKQAPSGDMQNVETAAQSFEAKVEYTITNEATGDKRTLIGHYKYTKK